MTSIAGAGHKRCLAGVSASARRADSTDSDDTNKQLIAPPPSPQLSSHTSPGGVHTPRPYRIPSIA